MMTAPAFAKILLAGSLALIASMATAAEPCTWKPVRVGGGGATTTIQAHPLVKNLYFITTDVGTPYRWNAAEQRWEGMLYKNGPEGWEKRAAVSRLAFDPSDASGNTLYGTTGGSWAVNGTVLKSVDRGNTWSDCQVLLDVKPNSEQSAGQRIAVDPHNSSIVYVTTRSVKPVTGAHGTFKTTKAGAPGSWAKINDLCGNFVLFDPAGGLVNGVTRTIYIGTEEGVQRSTDGGQSFVLMPGSPAKAVKAALHSSGTLYITGGSGVHKWDGTDWTAITPPTPGTYGAVAVNPASVNQVVVSSDSFTSYQYIHYRSKDGGATWSVIDTTPDLSEAPWFDSTIGQATRTFCWDPFNPKMVWFTDFFFAYQTTDIWAEPRVTWKARAAGHEETVTTGTLLSPPAGGNVLHSSTADVGGFDHKSVTVPPSVGMMTFFPWTPTSSWGNMTGVAVQETNPDFIARVGRAGWEGNAYCGYSADGGKTYTKWTSPSDAAGGRIAVSATSETMVWVTQQNGSYRSTDRGVTWTPITTLPNGILAGGRNIFSTGPRYPLAADKINGSKFYVYHDGRLHVSTDGGATFAAAGALPGSAPTDPLSVETTPGKEGDVWVGILNEGLFHSTDSGAKFTKVGGIKSASFLSIGKASPQYPSVPALYVLGTTATASRSLFRSIDNGATWTDLGAPAIGKDPVAMAADRRVYGRVYFGTAGNGLIMGEIESSVK